MEKAYNAIKLLIVQWNELRKNYPNETDFSALGSDGIKAINFDQMFSKWETTLEHFAGNKSYDSDPEVYATDMYLEKILNQIKGIIETNKAKGFGDLPNSSFFQWVSDASLLMSSVADMRISLHNDLAQSARAQISKDAVLIKDAAAAARKLSNLDLPNKVQKAESALNKATGSLDKVNAVKSEADALKKELTSYREALPTTQTEVNTIVSNIRTLNKTSADTLDSIDKQRQGLVDEIIKAEASIKQANEKVSKALENISRQGLAGSFAAQAKKIRFERILWLVAFALSIIGLIVIASFTVYGTFIHTTVAKLMAAHDAVHTVAADATLTVKTSSPGAPPPANPDWWKDFLRELPFAAPLIWFGWFSARQIGTLSKIQQDYNYKASTAVAFEGYKKEVAAIQDEALSKKLLETAILNFGENPIRLYGGKDDHGMPIEALLAKIFDDKTFDGWLPKFQKLCDAVGKCLGRTPA